ncbi:MAG: DciA family protein [Gammaproteobacteria bacterium]
MATHPLSFKQALSHPNRALATLYAQIDQQKLILAGIKRALPPQLAEHARHCVITGKKLIVFTESAAWATQLRFYNKVIFKAAEPITRQSIEIVRIRIFEPFALQPEESKRTAKVPSADKIAEIRSNVADDPDDPLSQALLKLSSTLDRLSGQLPDRRL